jgi:hypothetical protein
MLVHANPFAHFSTSQRTRIYPDETLIGGTISIGAFGRNGGPGLRFDNYQDAERLLNVAPASGAVHIQQADFRISADPSVVNGIMSVYDGSTEHCTLAVNTDRTLAVYRGSAAGTLLGTSSYVVPLDTDIHIGFKVTIDDAAGTVLVHVWEDGDTSAQVVLNLSAKDTKNTANATWNGYGFGGATSTGTTDFSNYVVMDGSGSSANDLLGPVDVRALFASGRLAPSLTDWSLSAGSDVAALLSETSPDDDATYLGETTQNEQMTVAVDQVPAPSRSILGAQLYACVKLTSGTPTLKAIGYQSAVANLGATFTATASYAYLQQPYSALPDGTPFSTAAVFDALQWGLKLTSNTTGARVTQIVVAVIQSRDAGRRNLVTGYAHTVRGDDNVVSGQSNTVIGSNSQAHGSNATVIGDRSVLINLDGVPRTLTGNGLFEVYGVVGGDLTLAPGTGDMFLIEEKTPSGVGTITFSVLGSYTNLELRWNARGTDAAASVNMNCTFNGDTGANYDLERVQGAGATASATEQIAGTSNFIATVTSAGGTANMASAGKVEIYDYRNTTFQKNGTAQVICHRTTASGNTLQQSFGFSWRNTAAITSITLTLSAGNFVAGSKFSLYGIN